MSSGGPHQTTSATKPPRSALAVPGWLMRSLVAEEPETPYGVRDRTEPRQPIHSKSIPVVVRSTEFPALQGDNRNSRLISEEPALNRMQRQSLEPETDRFERDRLDYETTVKRFDQITEIRFKLLGLVPTVTGVGVVVTDTSKKTPDTTIAIGILGLLVVIGVIIYEIRNTQLYDALWLRAICLEASMEFKPINENDHYGGSFLSQPHDRRTLERAESNNSLWPHSSACSRIWYIGGRMDMDDRVRCIREDRWSPSILALGHRLVCRHYRRVGPVPVAQL
jgi:hypothetical protein